MGTRRRITDDRGFTLVEVMVAVVLLLVGVLGVVTMVTGANAQTAVTKSREGATNLAREVLDAARGVDYNDDLTPSAIIPALQAEPGLADSDTSVAGWQINRRGVTYTIAQPAICIIDGQADGFGAHPAPSDPAAPAFCSGQTTGTTDPNPDDFRRMDVTVTWSVQGQSYSLRDTTLIINPSGGIGPTVKSLCRVTTATTANCTAPGSNIESSPTTTNIFFAALTLPADTAEWTVNDGSNPVDVTSSNPGGPAGTVWNYTWNIGTPAPDSSDICSSTINWELDGNYIVTAQAISGIGANAVAGPLRPYTATINRDAPYKVCGLVGGYDNPTTPWVGHPVGVDLEWAQNPERDVVGYRMYRVKGGSDTNDVLVCDTTNATNFPYVQGNCVCTTQTSCVDVNPRNGGGPVTYRVTALDHDPNTGQIRESQQAMQATIISDQSGSNNPPADFPPVSVTLSSSGGNPVITWPTVTDPDTGDRVSFYRIYRDGIGYANRYDRVDVTASGSCTASSTTCSYTDAAPSAGGDTYWVTAVDSHYDESSPEKAGP
jgi:prepilin-type N-terminal cleavage/methylation domain-containing protein